MLITSYVLDAVLFIDILISLRTAIVTPHGASAAAESTLSLFSIILSDSRLHNVIFSSLDRKI